MKKILTVVLDGFGLRTDKNGNAIVNASPTNFIHLWNTYPHTTLYASEEYVGLKKGQFGNSEIGHMTIGAGYKILQKNDMINNFLDNVKDNEEFLNMISYLKETEKTVHLMGLFSDGCVHSDMNHFLKMYDRLVEFGINNINFHLITDGRDTSTTASMGFVKTLNDKIKSNKMATISSVCGRYYAMDRDHHWDRTKNYYDLVINGRAIKSENLKDTVNICYKKDVTDEFLPPIATDKYRRIKDGDVLIWMNYRNDRARQILEAITNKDFSEFKTTNLENTKVYSFFEVEKTINTIKFLDEYKIENPLGIYLSKLGITQARIAETEKYAHVTFFLDGEYDGNIAGCNKYLINSPSVATYDLKPEMSAYEVCDKAISCMEKDVDFIFMNFANADMVGHTGDYEATVKAIKAIDDCLGKLEIACEDNFYKMIITADHGNADIMIDENGQKVTTHTISKVPFIITDNSVKLKDSGDLTMIAPTILEYMDIKKPEAMENTPSLFKNN